jgi:hypothetical protein
MLDLDRYVDIWSYNSSDGPRSQKTIDTNIRQENKILLEATNQSVKLTTQRNSLGSSFEALLRSVGLGAGVLLGGPVGAATVASIAGGVGRGVGEYLGNRIYGRSINDLEKILSDNKYKQLLNYAAKSNNKATLDLNDEFYKQANEELGKTITDIGQQQ